MVFKDNERLLNVIKSFYIFILVHLYTHTRDSFLQEMSRQNVSKKQFLLVLMVSTCWSSGSESQSQEQFRVICKPITIKSSLRLSTSHQAGTYWINQVIIIHILGVHDRAYPHSVSFLRKRFFTRDCRCHFCVSIRIYSTTDSGVY